MTRIQRIDTDISLRETLIPAKIRPIRAIRVPVRLSLSKPSKREAQKLP
jgi:hypothetical protein